MSIAEKLVKIAENEQKVYDAGAKSEYDRFWDTYQKENARMGAYMFAGAAWTDELLKLKYDVVPTNAIGMFMWAMNLVDVAGCFEKAGVKLDTSNCTDFTNFANSAMKIKRFPPLDLSKARIVSNMFSYCYALKELKLINSIKTVSYNNGTFIDARSLTDLEITGEIGQSINLKWSPLNKASIVNVLSILSPEVTEQSATFKKTAVDSAFETSSGAADGSESDEWITLVAEHENWTVSLA